MARPKKPDHLKMDTDLRIPVTWEQKSIIDSVVSTEPMGMAAWVRTVIMEAAEKKLEKKNDAKRKTK